jgi:predicted metalloprotease with PDZ domain
VGHDVAEPVRRALTAAPDPPSPRARRRPPLALLAVLLTAGNVLYAGLWIYHVRHRPRARVGMEVDYVAREAEYVVRSVDEAWPARPAGLRAGDHIVAVDGRPLTGPYLDRGARRATWCGSP